jgi:hypothetical protein
VQARTISSAWTFSAKFLFPAILISAFGFGTILFWSGGLVDRNSATPPPPQLKFVFLGAWILGTTVMLWANAGLKRVRMDERQLYVSNYLEELSIPFSLIEDVRQNRWINPRPVTIFFADTTAFGSKVKFMPKQRLQFWSVDPVVNELKQLAGLVAPGPDIR